MQSKKFRNPLMKHKIILFCCILHRYNHNILLFNVLSWHYTLFTKGDDKYLQWSPCHSTLEIVGILLFFYTPGSIDPRG